MSEVLDIEPLDNEALMAMTVNIVSSFVSNNPVQSNNLPELIREIHGTVADLAAPEEKPEPRPDPFVPVKKSVTPDYLICLEDGKKLKMLKRYLRTQYDMTPDDYRKRWNLDADYPMVAPNYAKRRSEFAKQIGLGRKADAEEAGKKKK